MLQPPESEAPWIAKDMSGINFWLLPRSSSNQRDNAYSPPPTPDSLRALQPPKTIVIIFCVGDWIITQPNKGNRGKRKNAVGKEPPGIFTVPSPCTVPTPLRQMIPAESEREKTGSLGHQVIAVKRSVRSENSEMCVGSCPSSL